LAAYYIAGLEIEVAFIIGGLFVVTGPTVIIPLLRQAKLKPRIAAVLKWEGIIVDPAGPLLALLAYQVTRVLTNEALSFSYLLSSFFGSLVAFILRFVPLILFARLAIKGLFPASLPSPLLLSVVLLSFPLPEVVIHVPGLLAVAILGLTLGQTKRSVSSIGDI